jgi:cold shock CspA family protein
MTVLQATVATYDPDTRGGTVLTDSGREISFDANAFARSGLRMLRLGQRVKMRLVAGRVEALTHISFPLPQPEDQRERGNRAGVAQLAGRDQPGQVAERDPDQP